MRCRPRTRRRYSTNGFAWDCATSWSVPVHARRHSRSPARRARELRVHVRIDERSAGFFALGRALATHEPVAIVVTSGTAAAELHACVAEASQAFVPLLVLTADRPPELHGVGAPQTIDQHELFGEHGAPLRRSRRGGTSRTPTTWRELAGQLWCSATNGTTNSPSAGPVHLNAAFIEPLVADALALPESSVPFARSPVTRRQQRRARRPSRAVRRRSRRVGSDGRGLPVVELGRRR